MNGHFADGVAVGVATTLCEGEGEAKVGTALEATMAVVCTTTFAARRQMLVQVHRDAEQC